MEGCVPGLEVANISTIHIASAEVQSHGHSIGKGPEKVLEAEGLGDECHLLGK